jgi:hypothetical protein
LPFFTPFFWPPFVTNPLCLSLQVDRDISDLIAPFSSLPRIDTSNEMAVDDETFLKEFDSYLQKNLATLSA